MNRTLLISGQRANFTTLSLDVDKRELSIVAECPGPFNVSWVEPLASHGDVDRLVGLSEGDESGLLYTFEIDHEQKTCNITSQKSTLGAPAHFVTLPDGSALALSTYCGGSVALYPTSVTEKAGLLLADDQRTELLFDFPYKSVEHERVMYVLGELSHTVVAFDLSTSPADEIQPIDGFSPKVVPPSVHPDHQLMMDSAEICLHPNIPNVLYVSNRWERHIADLEPHLENVPKELPPGDAIAIILLSDDGRRVHETKFVRTNLDTIRGMRLSSDGSLVAMGGQEGGGVEIYGISGERGDVWTLVASLNKGLESGIKHAIWL
ncbi:hypothetical protein INS49_006109 [Diaporthe citri]|uniref:uncharacterized protein n=1 Tax=Diaporthe citri TaxID=83186 RepID=UPI001C7F2F94|nr:uncharacterized protein INS49_006109 [Diaporthe citri]KAG6364508.1 hypothetical protein INS49_006109 [Diaporthe citri]